MSNYSEDDKKMKIKRVIELLSFALTLKDKEIMFLTIEEIIEMLKELDD